MKKENFCFEYLGKEKIIEVSKVPWFKEGLGLMFSSKKKAQILLFDLKKNSKLGIHSFFVRFPFIAIWINENKKVVEIKKILPYRGLIKPKKSFRYLIEIPLIRRYDAVIKKLFLDSKAFE